ncbi:hypothetical protein BS50DRAFT_631279 [Corynespora cassiicola Philippines]|uniref:Uncharacterized protein n=1 Tax=Corynespora cassiicola Philippines TaxID=1448308 RepID=A0A2T2P1A6_CORCC|nr:hypothetical protein BS50DRAFT_631279 [Corynespora cassiicola Philippines]
MRLRQSTQRRPPRRYSLNPPSTPLRPSPLRRNGRRKVPTASRSHTHQQHSDAVLQCDSSSRQSCALSSTSFTPQRQRTAFSVASSSHCSFNAQPATMVNGRTVRLRNKGADPPAASRARKRKHDLLDDSAFDAWLVERPFELDPQLYLGSIAGEEHHHNELPAAFPSLNPGQERPVNHGRHDIARLIEERKDAARRGDSYERIDQIYNDNIFPSNMAEEEQDWYRDLNDRLVDSNHADKVSALYPELRSDSNSLTSKKIDIMSLYYSLRQTIILEMCGEVEGIHLYDHFYPAKFLLNLSNRGIQKAMEETDFRDDKHFDLRMAKKGQKPEDSIDPEEPLGFEVVDAIKYLKQKHLPASLLGKWQLPLPDEDIFKDPATKASYAPEAIEESAEVSTHTGSLVTELNQSKISGSHVSPASRRTLLQLIEGIEQAPLSPKMEPSTFMGMAKAKLQATTANSPAPSPSASPSASSSNSPQAYSSVAPSESSPASPVLSPAPSQSRSKITDSQLAGAAFVSPKEDFDPDYEPSESHDSQDKEKVAAETLVEPSTPPTKFDEPAQNTTSTSKFDHSRRCYSNIIGPRVSPLVRKEEAYTPKPADARDELAKTRKTPSKSVFENFEEQTQIVRDLNARVNGTSSPQQIRPPMAQPNQRSAQQQQNGHPMYAMMSPEQQTKMQQLERQRMLQQDNYAGQQQRMRQQHNYGLPLYGQQSPGQTAQQYSQQMQQMQQMQQIQQAQQVQRGMRSPQLQEYGMHMPQMGSPNYWLVQQQQLIRNGMNHSSRQPARQQ